MKNVFLATVALFALGTSAFAADYVTYPSGQVITPYDNPAQVGVKYPAGSSASAIAVNEAVRAQIAGTLGTIPCAVISTRNGACTQIEDINGGGGSSE